MPKSNFVQLPREQLYHEIWEQSVKVVASNYGIAYHKFMCACKDANIPIPSSGYWTALTFGKMPEKTALPQSDQKYIVIEIDSDEERENAEQPPFEKMYDDSYDQDTSMPKLPDTDAQHLVLLNIDNITFDRKGKNTYNREQLYKEVWKEPVIHVAKKYGVSDVAIRKVCKSMDIPIPPRGYWAKIHAGMKVEKTPLPSAQSPHIKYGTRSLDGDENLSPYESLSFLGDEERQRVSKAVKELYNPSDIHMYHPVIGEHMRTLKRWEVSKNDSVFYNIYHRPPLLAENVSEEQRPRIYRFLTILFEAVEKLGGSVNGDLSLQIRGERVQYTIEERKERLEHETNEEDISVQKEYEDRMSKGQRWMTKPQIPKYDYVYSGRLRIEILENIYRRDSRTAKIESMLGQILIDLYKKSQNIKNSRMKNQAVEPIESLRNVEIAVSEHDYSDKDNTAELLKMAEDYHTACKIRALIQAIQALGKNDDNTRNWISWANEEAKRIDPTIT